MSTAAIELPLFPFSIVLFPGTVLPLHIFEPRYRQMVKDCLRENKPFGMVLARAGSEHLNEDPHPIGTMAEIHNLSQLEDGCYNLMAVGMKRFRIVSRHREKPYLSGFVEPFDDVHESDTVLTGPVKAARNLFETYLNMVLDVADEKELETNLPDTPEDLSHFVAHFLEVEDARKQHFLELTSTHQRLQEEIAILRREIPFLRQILFKKVPDDLALLN
jgi:Lon protease-like protein